MPCRACAPDLYPSGPRQGEHHFAVRFGDAPLDIYIYLDGARVWYCTEVVAGADGVVVCEPASPIPALCPCGSGLMPEIVRRGLVEVTNHEREE
jgi:streptogramin lyase